MFLLIVGHNVRMRVVAYYFQHFIVTIAQRFKEVRQALCQLGKLLICPHNIANEVPSYIANNPKYFSCLG